MSIVQRDTLLRLTVRTFVMVAIGIGGAVACGGGAEDELAEGETLSIDNCTLVTDEEASAFAGVKLARGEDSPLGCPYTRPGSSMGYFIVRAFTADGPAKDHFGQHSDDTTVHEISGVGDSAAVLARGEDVNFLIVQKGRRYVQFVTTFVSDVELGSPKLKEAQDLALVALDRIN